MSQDSSSIPVTIFSGFLGAGKTTFLSALLADLNPFGLVLAGNKTNGYPLKEILAFRRLEHPDKCRMLK